MFAAGVLAVSTEPSARNQPSCWWRSGGLLSPEKSAGWSLRGAAFYADEYVKQGGRWLIRHTGYTRIYEESHLRKDIPSLRLTASRWGTADGE